MASVNGAGKSSIGGRALKQAGLDWFNPDTFARQWAEASGCAQADANAVAWQEGLRRRQQAIATGRNFAFETTLGGKTIAATLRKACATHDVLMWFCGLDSPEHHLARVQFRVSRGGHDIPEAKIRERWVSSIANLITLLPQLTQLQVYDNSTDAAADTPIPNPHLLLQMKNGRIKWPGDAESLRRTPDWAKSKYRNWLDLQPPHDHDRCYSPGPGCTAGYPP